MPNNECGLGVLGLFCYVLCCIHDKPSLNHLSILEGVNLVPRVFSLSNMAAAGETLAHSELKRSLIGAFCCAFIRALSLVYSFQKKDGYPLRAS